MLVPWERSPIIVEMSLDLVTGIATTVVVGVSLPSDPIIVAVIVTVLVTITGSIAPPEPGALTANEREAMSQECRMLFRTESVASADAK